MADLMGLVREAVRRRQRISEKAMWDYGKKGYTRLVDYHSGAMTVCACLLSDLDVIAKKKRAATKSRDAKRAVATVGAQRKK